MIQLDSKIIFTKKNLLWFVLVVAGIAVIFVGSRQNTVSSKIQTKQQSQKIPCQAETTASIKDPKNNVTDALEQSVSNSDQNGRKLVIYGTITDTNCNLIPHAQVIIWQADAAGSSNKAWLGKQYTDQNGKYSFVTVMPGSYQNRTPHINIAVQATTQSVPLITQLFFPDIKLNKTDPYFDDSLQYSVHNTADALTAQYNLVVER